jgi:hypothetical protein
LHDPCVIRLNSFSGVGGDVGFDRVALGDRRAAL